MIAHRKFRVIGCALMDGGTRQFGDKSYFILGLDGMVKYHKGFTSEVPFFHHELFHVYHSQYLTEEMTFWVGLWGEGLATYAAERLNPQASLEELMLSKSMVAQVNKNLGFYWQDLLSKLESKDEEGLRKVFFDVFYRQEDRKSIWILLGLPNS